MGETENYRIRSIVVEDEQKILENICNKIVSLDSSFEIVEKACNGQEAIEKIEQLRPQVVFTDISMPVMDGMKLIRRIKEISPNTIIVIISGYSDFSYAQQAIRYGVFNYLLKPLENDVLMETLFDIRKSLSYAVNKKQRHVIYSAEYQVIPEKKKPFMVVAVCIGNVIFNTQDDEVNRFYREEMNGISLGKIMKKLFDGREWFAADDHAANQKIIAIKKEEDSDSLRQFIPEIVSAIQEETTLSVSICCTEEDVEQEELWNVAKRLRNILKRKVVIGESHVFYLEEEEQNTKNDLIEIIKMKLNAYTKNYFVNTDLESFLNEIQIVFKYMKNNHVTQESIEKICLYVLKMLEFSEKGYERERIEEIQNEILNKISIAVSEEKVFESLIQIFSVNRETEEEKDVTAEVDRLQEYIDEHYLTLESMETVAVEFDYNYTYLSRMFKKKVGESMSQYILNKKIGLAKEMLETNPELKVTEVSDLCGYSDYRYFGRVFKKNVGISPSEYKEQIESINS